MRLLALACLVSIDAGSARAQAPNPAFYQMTRPQIARTLKQLHKRNPILSARIAAVSRYFLGTPYHSDVNSTRALGPLGEGPSGQFDRLPTYSFQSLDCTTFVEEAMALSLDPDLDHALRVTLQRIRYKGGHVAYEDRNHFAEIDWLPNNAAAGFIEDITRGVGGGLTKEAHKTISKRAWYLAKTETDLEGLDRATDAERQRAVDLWHQQAASYSDVVATVPYISLADLPSVEAAIPSGTIANLVRADRADKAVMISHQFLLIRDKGVLYAREAAYKQSVMDVPLADFLAKYSASSWPALGLNLDAIRHP